MGIHRFNGRRRHRAGAAALTLALLAAPLFAAPATEAAQAAQSHRSTLKLPTLVEPETGPAGTTTSVEGGEPAATGIDPPFTGLDETANGASASDSTVASGATKVLQAVNRSLRMTSTSGGNAQAMTLEQFFGAAGQGDMFDPKVHFDRNAVDQRFYVVALQDQNVDDADPTNDFSAVHLAVSRSAAPSGLDPANWCRYELDGLVTSPATNNQPSFADFPGLGVGADGIVITSNQFTGKTFAVTTVRTLDKSVYSHNAVSCPLEPYWEFDASSSFNDFTAHTLQPAQHYTNPTSFPGRANPVYLVSTRPDVASSSYRVWRIANIAPFNQANPPVLESTSVPWSTYSVPPNAPGGAGGAKVDTGDTRILQVAGVGDAITAAHTISCQFTNGTPLESCLRVVRLVMGQSAGGVMTATKSELQGLGGGDNAFYHHPGVAVNNNNQTAVVFLANLPGNAHRISSRVAVKALGAGFGASVTLTDGTCARAPVNVGDAVRSGDYTGAQTAVDGTAFWVTAEHAELIGGVCRWKTRVTRVTP
ncbi:hypothetical protein [Saccharothrix stipae]